MGNEQALNNAKNLRASQTDAEQRLWRRLRAHRFMDLKFKGKSRWGVISWILSAWSGG